jgi:hypothetical protein
MLYTKHNFEIAVFCAKSDVHPELRGILVAPDKTAATDSFVLLEVTAPADIPITDFPAVPGVSVMTPTERFIFPKDAAIQVLKSIPRKASQPVMQRAALLQTENGTAGFVTTDLEKHTPVVAREIDAQFPVYEALFPTAEPKSVVRVNAEYLEKLAKFFRGFGNGHVIVKTFGEFEAILLESVTTDPQKARALLMPIRS